MVQNAFFLRKYIKEYRLTKMPALDKVYCCTTIQQNCKLHAINTAVIL